MAVMEAAVVVTAGEGVDVMSHLIVEGDRLVGVLG
jgi:hypothetical protein